MAIVVILLLAVGMAVAFGRSAWSALAGGIEEIKAVLARREPIWRAMACAEVDVSGKTPEQVATEILALQPLNRSGTGGTAIVLNQNV